MAVTAYLLIQTATDSSELSESQWSKISSMITNIKDTIFPKKFFYDLLDNHNDCYVIVDYLIFVRLLNKMKNSQKEEKPNEYYISVFKDMIRYQVKGKEIIKELPK
jgi:hypothetical protein